MAMYNPMHPGEVIKELYIKESGMSLRAVAKALGVSAPTFRVWSQEKVQLVLKWHLG